MRIPIFIICLLVLSFVAEHASAQFYKVNEPLAHTYSIVAYDESTGEMGVAVQSHWFQVGPIVAWGEAGVGVVATQSLVNPALGPNGLQLMKMGLPAEKALQILIEEDDGRAYRQVAMLDANGGEGVHTGEQCIQSAGHHLGTNYSVQANLMTNDAVWPAMAEAFEKATGSLAERMMTALEAAEAAGGDIRGKQSAALLIVAPKSTNRPWVDRRVDLRVDDHPHPLVELRRLYNVQMAYQHMNEGDLAMEKEDVEGALESYGSAMRLNPDNEEMRFWYAVSLANSNLLEDALPHFKQVFDKNDNWRTLTPRLVDNGLLQLNEEQVSRIVQQ